MASHSHLKNTMLKRYIQLLVLIVAAPAISPRALSQTSSPPFISIIQHSAGVQVAFTHGLQSADTPAGPWTDVMQVTSPLNAPTNRPAAFFRAVKKSNQMRIKIGSSSFIATLEDNATATAFRAQLPLTLNMVELNGNEKYSGLSTSLPTNASNPGTIQSGDLMLYGSQTLVLFYKTFSTPYSYTRLGRINDPAGLAPAVGSGNVTVTFQRE